MSLSSAVSARGRGDRLWLVRDSDGKVFAAVDLEQARAYRSPEPIPSWPAHGGVLVEYHRPPPWDGSERTTSPASEMSDLRSLCDP